MYLDKCMYSKEDPNCFIKYRVNIDNFNDYWYYDFSSVFKKFYGMVYVQLTFFASTKISFVVIIIHT